jgi:hypothetical protein
MSRPLVTMFNAHGMTIDTDSLSTLVIAQTKNMYTGVMHLPSKTLYFAALSKPVNDKDNHYGTMTPTHLDAFPCRVGGGVIRPIMHNDPSHPKPTTSHDQLSQYVIAQRGGGATPEDFCGFALRFEDGKKAWLAPTSRTLNPGENGQLEECILRATETYLKPKLALLGYTLAASGPRVTPDAAQLARGGVLIPKNLLAAIKRPK